MRITILFILCALLCCSEGHKQEECSKPYIPAPLIREMIKNISLIQNSLPKDDKRFQLMKNLRKCYKKLNVVDFKRILEMYDEHVFQKLWKNNTLQLSKLFMDNFRRLKGFMQPCTTTDKQTPSSCARENLKKLEEIFKKLQSEGQLKALSEFHSILVWIGLMDKRNVDKQIHKSSII